jgi:hypothetical protein
MAYGLQIDEFDFTYGTYSVVQKGTLGFSNVVINKADHPDITIWQVFFVPIGVRDTTKNELRPTYQETGTAITLSSEPDGTTSYLYFVLGR